MLKAIQSYITSLVRSLWFWVGLIPAVGGLYQTYYAPNVLPDIGPYLAPLFIGAFILANLSIYSSLYIKISESEFRFPIIGSRIEQKLLEYGILVTSTFTLENRGNFRATNFRFTTKMRNNTHCEDDTVSVRSDWMQGEKRALESKFQIPLTKDQRDEIIKMMPHKEAIRNGLRQIVSGDIYLDVIIKYDTIIGRTIESKKYLKYEFSRNEWIDIGT